MTARLILNLKTISDTPSGPQHHYGFDGARSTWEATIIGNIGNEFEGDNTGYSTTSDYPVSKGSETLNARRSEADERRGISSEYELEERQFRY